MNELNSESIDQIVAALLKANEQISNAHKDSTNPHFKSNFASLESVLDAIKKPYLSNGIAIVQQQQEMTLITTLAHSSGQWFRSYTPILSTSPNDPQKMGSGLTYARRYSLAAMAGIGQEDDDGNKASEKPKEPIKSHVTAKPVQQPDYKPRSDKSQRCICGKSMMVSKYLDPNFPNGFWFCPHCKERMTL